MGTKSYKCPSCGAGIHFKPEHQKFKCDFCLSEYTNDEIEKIYKEVDEKSQEKDLQGDNHLSSYECNSCGAKVVTDDTTTATFCYYCHNPVIISNRLVGDFEPDKLIPFSIEKNEAKNVFLKWAKKKKFVPVDFYSDSQLEKITGMYLPYWWANCEVDIDYLGEGRTIRVWRAGGREYTETKKFQIERKGKIDMSNVEELGFTKIDKNLLDGIAPYNESEAKDFSMPYLSGFFAEQYDITKEEVDPKIEEQVSRYSKSLINGTISGFNHINDVKNNVNILSKEWNYTLLPAWILTYIYNGKTYVYAVNGQTGKSFGELPFNKQKALTVSSIIFGITSIILLLGGALIW
jgi:DNA-directed RNA polymerase subunit RPC12/RpoP